MADSILAFSRLALASEDGRPLFHALDWALLRSQNIRITGIPGEEGTALLRLAVGALHPQEGEVILDGIPLEPYAMDHPFLQRGAVGWIPTEGGLMANQTLLDNLALPLMFTRGMAPDHAREAAREALATAGLEALADRRPHMLEAPERWLGCMARARVMEAELWLIDRPPSRLSPANRARADRILETALGSSASVILLGDEGWMPPGSVQAVGWKAGQLVPGVA